MTDGQCLTDDQLADLESAADRLDRITVPRLPPTATVDQMADQAAIIEGCNALRPLIAEVRAGRTREARLLAITYASDDGTEYPHTHRRGDGEPDALNKDVVTQLLITEEIYEMDKESGEGRIVEVPKLLLSECPACWVHDIRAALTGALPT